MRWESGFEFMPKAPQIVLLDKTQHLPLPAYFLPAALLRADGGAMTEMDFQDSH